ncbi:hypothetical protein BJX76DRAFT_340265 [Aspergillus varians]
MTGKPDVNLQAPRSKSIWANNALTTSVLGCRSSDPVLAARRTYPENNKNTSNAIEHCGSIPSTPI